MNILIRQNSRIITRHHIYSLANQVQIISPPIATSQGLQCSFPLIHSSRYARELKNASVKLTINRISGQTRVTDLVPLIETRNGDGGANVGQRCLVFAKRATQTNIPLLYQVITPYLANRRSILLLLHTKSVVSSPLFLNLLSTSSSRWFRESSEIYVAQSAFCFINCYVY